jgi:hypothetical protein
MFSTNSRKVPYDAKSETQEHKHLDNAVELALRRRNEYYRNGDNTDPSKNFAGIIIWRDEDKDTLSMLAHGVGISSGVDYQTGFGHSERFALAEAIRDAVKKNIIRPLPNKPLPQIDSIDKVFTDGGGSFQAFRAWIPFLEDLNIAVFTERAPCPPSERNDGDSCEEFLVAVLNLPECGQKHKVYHAIPLGLPKDVNFTLNQILPSAIGSLLPNRTPVLEITNLSKAPQNWQFFSQKKPIATSKTSPITNFFSKGMSSPAASSSTLPQPLGSPALQMPDPEKPNVHTTSKLAHAAVATKSSSSPTKSPYFSSPSTSTSSSALTTSSIPGSQSGEHRTRSMSVGDKSKPIAGRVAEHSPIKMAQEKKRVEEKQPPAGPTGSNADTLDDGNQDVRDPEKRGRKRAAPGERSSSDSDDSSSPPRSPSPFD